MSEDCRRPAGAASGLRREELALLAGISSTWYTYLEQGRDIRVSDRVLEALARTLRLDRHERDHLFHLAGHEPEPAESEVLAPEVAAVPSLLQPNPAYVIDDTYDVLSTTLRRGRCWSSGSPRRAGCWPGCGGSPDGTQVIPGSPA